MGMLPTKTASHQAHFCVYITILWTRLLDILKVPKRLILRIMFDQNKSILVINGEENQPIKNRRGLLQGPSLSPILFNHFINGLLIELNKKKKITTGGVK